MKMSLAKVKVQRVHLQATTPTNCLSPLRQFYQTFKTLSSLDNFLPHNYHPSLSNLPISNIWIVTLSSLCLFQFSYRINLNSPSTTHLPSTRNLLCLITLPKFIPMSIAFRIIRSFRTISVLKCWLPALLCMRLVIILSVHLYQEWLTPWTVPLRLSYTITWDRETNLKHTCKEWLLNRDRYSCRDLPWLDNNQGLHYSKAYLLNNKQLSFSTINNNSSTTCSSSNNISNNRWWGLNT